MIQLRRCSFISALLTGLTASLILLHPNPAQATRSTISLPLVARSYQWAGGGMTGTSGNFEFSFTNLSKVSQTLTIEVSDESFEQNIALSCGCACPGVGWPTQGGHCWRVVKATFPGGTRPTQSVTVPAGGSKEVTMLWNCKWLMSGPDCATSVTVDDVHSTTLLDAAGNNMIGAAMVTYRARAVITVAEDRGAILGRTSIGVGMINAVNQISTPMDYLLNGGRPF